MRSIKISTIIFLAIVYLNNTAHSQEEKSVLFQENGFFLSSGVGYMKEWKNSKAQFGSTNSVKDVTTPNDAVVAWVSAGYIIKKSYFFQFSFDREYTNEDDIDEKFWLSSLHFSAGRSLLLGDNKLRLFTGISSIKRIELLASFTQPQGGAIEYELTHAQNTGYLYSHFGAEFLSKLTNKISIGARTKIATDFTDFGRLDVSGMITIDF